MPSQPQAGRGSQASSTKGKASASAAKSPPRQSPPADTGTSDHVYGVVSVLYHALQGADTYLQYIEDARNAGDDELTSFFEQCREEEQRRAARAKALLSSRLAGDVDEEDEDEDEDEDDEDDDDDEDEDEDDEA
jgi:hypothetical protein